MYQGRLCIPYLNARGDVAQLRFRCLLPHECHESRCPKYLTMQGDDVRLFNSKALLTSDPVLHITEGEFDAMILTQLGLSAVGAPGVSSWGDRHTVMCSGFDAAYVWGDGDAAGREFRQGLARELENSRPIPVPNGHDVTSLFQSGGADAVLDLLKETEARYA